MTNQPLEEYRVFTFLLTGLVTSFTAQGFGLLAGSMFGLKVSLQKLFIPVLPTFYSPTGHVDTVISFSSALRNIYRSFDPGQGRIYWILLDI